MIYSKINPNANPRSIPTLLKLLFHELDYTSLPKWYGLCSSIIYLYSPHKISLSERDVLKEYIISHRPGIFSKFFWHKSYYSVESIFHINGFWWELSDSGHFQRKMFIEYLIDKSTK